MNLACSWSQIIPKPDPIYGSPVSRSSHGISVIRRKGDATVRIYLYGGEHDPRVPIDDVQCTWCAEPESIISGTIPGWRWRCIVPSEVAAAGEFPVPPRRVAHSQCSIGDKVYIFGGRCGQSMGESSFNDLWVLDCSTPGNEYWQQIQCQGTPPEPRSYHQMVAANDSLFVFGGCGADGRLADLHRFNTADATWTTLSSSTYKPSCLAGRGGANLVLLGNSKIAIIAGFVGEESRDGQIFDIHSNQWDTSHAITFQDMRARSVCSFASGIVVTRVDSDRDTTVNIPICVIFGGEVDPSDKGHAGAGSFEHDLWIVDVSSGCLIQNITPTTQVGNHEWPTNRGWASAASIQGEADFYLFGGLSGDDTNPIRLDDLWRCTFK